MFAEVMKISSRTVRVCNNVQKAEMQSGDQGRSLQIAISIFFFRRWRGILDF
jgi:hypothetical protein